MHHIHREGMKRYCEMKHHEFFPLLDWYVVRETDGGILGFKGHPDGDAKVLAIAHLDHLCSGVVHSCNRKKIVSSALDDRAGVYIAMHLLDEYGIKADVLLTDFEESGDSTVKMLGSQVLGKYNWLVQLDRQGEDVVTYGFTEMIPFLQDIWRVERGSFSDIAELENVSPVSAFNMGVAYVRQHTESCTLSWKVLRRQMDRLRTFYETYHDVRMDRDHVAGETSDYPRARQYKPYSNTRSALTVTTSKVVTAHAVPKYHCLGCGRELRYRYAVCGWCGKRDLGITKVAAKITPPKLVTGVVVQPEECDLCALVTDNLTFLGDQYGMDWWACKDCMGYYEKTEPVEDDPTAWDQSDPHFTREGWDL